jgi:hypothetical protein
VRETLEDWKRFIENATNDFNINWINVTNSDLIKTDNDTYKKEQLSAEEQHNNSTK